MDIRSKRLGFSEDKKEKRGFSEEKVRNGDVLRINSEESGFTWDEK